MPSNQSPSFYPAACVFAGASLWGVIWYPMRLLEQQGLGGLWLTLTLYAAAFAASLPFTYRAFTDVRRSPGWLAVLTLGAGWTNIAFVEAVLAGNILRVLLLFYLSPLWATLMGRLFLGERITGMAALSLLVASSGAVFMLWNPATGIPWPETRADWFALTAGFAFALSNVATRAMQETSVPMKMLCVWVGVTGMALVMIGLFGLPMPEVTAVTWSGAAALGVGGILLMTLLVQYGVTHIPVYRSAVIMYAELIAGALSQALLTDEVVTWREWGGGALIVGGTYLAVWASARREPR